MLREFKWKFLTWKCDMSESVDLGVTVSLFLQGWPRRCSRRVQEMYKVTQSNTSAAWIAMSAGNAGRHNRTARRQHAKGSQWSYIREDCRFIEAGADSWCKDSWCPKHTRYPGRGVGWERIDQTAKEFPYGKTQIFLIILKKKIVFALLPHKHTILIKMCVIFTNSGHVTDFYTFY